MHRSSETIGAIASALAKAQGKLSNPEKALTATIPLRFPARPTGPFLCLLASGLDVSVSTWASTRSPPSRPPSSTSFPARSG